MTSLWRCVLSCRLRRPGFLSPSAGLKFADIPNGLAAVSKVPVAGWAQIAAYFGFVEFSGGFDDYKSGTPGDYGFKVLTSSDPAEKTKKLSAELANGRLAMMAIIGMFFQASFKHCMILSPITCMYVLELCNLHIGRPHRQRLGRLGELHGLASACLRERARCAGNV